MNSHHYFRLALVCSLVAMFYSMHGFSASATPLSVLAIVLAIKSHSEQTKPRP